MRTLFLATAGLLALAVPPAFAQDADPDAEPFTGFHVGGSIGYSVQGSDVGEGVLFDRNLDGRFGDTVVNAAGANVFSPGFCNGSPNGNNAGAGCSNDRDGVEFSLRAGYDRQMGNLVVGVIGEFGTSRARDSVTAFTTTPASYTFTRQLDWYASARGRIGYAANTTLFYATGGITYGKIDNRFSSSNTINTFTGRGDEMSWGAQFGGGVEQKLGRNFSVGVEYLYTRFRDDDYRVRASQGAAAANHPFVLGNAAGTDFLRSDSRFDYHGVRLTAAYRF